MIQTFLKRYFYQISNKEFDNFFPGYFSLVMATGIVSIACFLLGFIHFSKILFYLNILFYLILWLFFIAHTGWFSTKFLQNLGEHSKSPGYLTLIAGTNVLGSQFVVIAQNATYALILAITGFVLWVLLLYLVIFLLTIKKEKPTLEQGINGIWLLIVVSTQSVAVIGMQVAPAAPRFSELIIFNSVGFFLMGCMLYIILITLIFYRLTFFELNAGAFAPPYWINMGAVSITTLAGATILLNPLEFPEFLNKVSPFIKGFTFLFWAVGTWWIPLIFILGIWRHLYKKIPLFYHHQYWGMVFPLGMYTVCTLKLAEVLNIDFMLFIPKGFIYIAVSTWVLAFLGLCTNILKNIKSSAKNI